MLSITHTLVSIVFGLHLEHPIAIFCAAFLMHFFLDTIPHWNLYPEVWGKKFLPLAFLDVFAGLGVGWLITGSNFFTFPVLLAIFAGNLPDILHVLWEIGRKHGIKLTKNRYVLPFFHTHDKLQFETVTPFYGLIGQIIFSAAAIATIVYLG